MARFSLRLDDEAEDDPGTWVEREAERRDRTKALIREAVNAASDAESVYASDAGDVLPAGSPEDRRHGGVDGDVSRPAPR
jgi:hypothetical protein